SSYYSSEFGFEDTIPYIEYVSNSSSCEGRGYDPRYMMVNRAISSGTTTFYPSSGVTVPYDDISEISSVINTIGGTLGQNTVYTTQENTRYNSSIDAINTINGTLGQNTVYTTQENTNAINTFDSTLGQNMVYTTQENTSAINTIDGTLGQNTVYTTQENTRAAKIKDLEKMIQYLTEENNKLKMIMPVEINLKKKVQDLTEENRDLKKRFKILRKKITS
ncbi:35985_t:CDS:2, partial [Racocetra persica]